MFNGSGEEHGFGFNKESLFYRGLSLELTCSQHPEERVRPFQRSSNLPVLFRDLFPTTIIMGWCGWICLGSANKTACFLWANVGVFYTPLQAGGVYADRQWWFYRRSWLVRKRNTESSLLKAKFKSLSSLNYRFVRVLKWRGSFIAETWITSAGKNC